MNKTKLKYHGTRKAKAIIIVLLIDVVAILGEMEPWQRIFTFAWSIAWFSTSMTWRILWDDHEIKGGYKIPWGSFLIRRRLLFSEVGLVFLNKMGDVVLLNKSELKLPGKKEVYIPHNLNDFKIVVGEVLRNVDVSVVDENVQLLMEGIAAKKTKRFPTSTWTLR